MAIPMTVFGPPLSCENSDLRASSTRRRRALHGPADAALPKLWRMVIPLTSNANLSHHRDGYVIVKCRQCGHRRDIKTEALARLFGWDRKVRVLAERFRCSNCGAKDVDVSFGYDQKPRGWKKNPS
jgi:predicted RNA-binding Zn-ribbon protein involved in translation (DUF1610 family)